MTDPNDHVAKALKHLRKSRNWSLDVTAGHTGVSKAMLGQIERGESYPTTATLWKIATGFEVSISSLIEAVPEEPTETLLRDAKNIRQNRSADGLAVAPLFPFEQRLGFEYMELSFRAGYERLSDPHEPGVIEFITVISGKLEILADENWHVLEVGQSLRFRGDHPHGYRNRGRETAVVMTIIHYPRRP
ncbi:XRE family transcriptional regulator [Sneathiella marina]|uniref:XRE family transcriptional regulator n=1 Tax=Sneathiella marina TaxID=2950108 RepID=A0ABY4W839_9PROT|nr:XRE family transcriptional regulator [Sneathiella marina]USG60821.1 XRE family transcriptional regulator [Sneathiella marina]